MAEQPLPAKVRFARSALNSIGPDDWQFVSAHTELKTGIVVYAFNSASTGQEKLVIEVGNSHGRWPYSDGAVFMPLKPPGRR